MKTKIILSIILVISLIFVYYLWTKAQTVNEELTIAKNELEVKSGKLSYIQERYEEKSEELQRKNEAFRLLFVDVAEEKINNFLRQTGFPILPAGIDYYDEITTENMEKRWWNIVESTAIPWIEKGHFKGILTFSREINPDPQLFIVDLKSVPQVEWKDYQDLVGRFLQEGDHILKIKWGIGKHGWFLTFIVLSNDGKLKFEPMMYFTAGPSEIQGKKITETIVTWNGNVKNNLGMKAITWKARVTFKANGTYILGDPYGSFDSVIPHIPLWRIKDARFDYSNKTKLPLDSGFIETQIANFALSWANGFTRVKIDYKGKGIELENAGTVGATLRKFIELRGDGSAWSHGEHIPVK